MILRAAGHGGLVSPLEFGGGSRKLPPWMWGAIGVSVALHVAGGIFLYNQQFMTVAPPDPVAERPPLVLQEWLPRPKPAPSEAQAPQTNVRVRQAASPPANTPTAPFAPTPDAATGDGPPALSDQVDPTPPTATGTGDTPAPLSVIRNPTWVSKPTSAQMERAYPQRAAEEGVGGRATIQCAVTITGALTGCSVISETPVGRGFGGAGLRLSKYFRMSPQTIDGRPVEGALVTVPIVFSME